MTSAALSASPSTASGLTAADFALLIGAANVATDPAKRDVHAADWSGWSGGAPAFVLMPTDTEGLARCVALCAARGQPIAVQGGLTGLCGGASCRDGEVALSLEKLVGVEVVDPVGGTMTVKAGTPLEVAQEAARAAGLELGIDLGSRGSCTIGGVISTNAGGIRVIATGMTRAHVLGLEAVLADGTVLSDMNTMLKNNSGYDLKQLFVGTEGTLGIVTRAVLRLAPAPAATATALAALPRPEDVTLALAAARKMLGPSLSAFEAMWADFLTCMTERGGYSQPFAGVPPMSVIIETRGNDEGEERARIEAFLAHGMEEGWVGDAVIAGSLDQTRRIWAPRDEGPAEYSRMFGGTAAFDVSIPIALIVETAAAINAEIRAKLPDAIPVTYGHIGDANLHLVVGFEKKPAAETKQQVERIVYEAIGRVGGAVSAEHGIGLLKKAYLPLSRGPAALDLMRRMKVALDPAGILNPGRVI